MLRMGREGPELRVLGGILAASSALWVFVEIAEEVVEGDARAIDTAILMAFRAPGDASDPLGPPWLDAFSRDITALGSPGVLGLLVAATCLFLLLARRRRTALFVLGATASGTLASVLLKLSFNRPRPDLVAHHAYVTSASFPSGHAMLALLSDARRAPRAPRNRAAPQALPDVGRPCAVRAHRPEPDSSRRALAERRARRLGRRGRLGAGLVGCGADDSPG